jgi:hypothetical protein
MLVWLEVQLKTHSAAISRTAASAVIGDLQEQFQVHLVQ